MACYSQAALEAAFDAYMLAEAKLDQALIDANQIQLVLFSCEPQEREFVQSRWEAANRRAIGHRDRREAARAVWQSMIRANEVG